MSITDSIAFLKANYNVTDGRLPLAYSSCVAFESTSVKMLMVKLFGSNKYFLSLLANPWPNNKSSDWVS